MLDHIDFAVADLDRSRAFYRAVLVPLGYTPLIEIDRGDGRVGTGFGDADGARFWIGAGPPVAGRLHIAFKSASRQAVDAFHAAGLAAGGADHGPPGLRPRYGEPYYAAFVRDPDGHIIEAVCRSTGAGGERPTS